VDLESYSDKSQRKYIHFVDGGITDNMGLRATYDVVTASGGPEVFLDKTNLATPDRMIVISIDASTEPVQDMDVSNKVPTSFKLSDEQVDRLIAVGRQLLREHPDFQRLLADLK
jgi:NTE family protein